MVMRSLALLAHLHVVRFFAIFVVVVVAALVYIKSTFINATFRIHFMASPVHKHGPDFKRPIATMDAPPQFNIPHGYLSKWPANVCHCFAAIFG